MLLRDLGDNTVLRAPTTAPASSSEKRSTRPGIRNSVLWVTRDFGVQVRPAIL